MAAVIHVSCVLSTSERDVQYSNGTYWTGTSQIQADRSATFETVDPSEIRTIHRQYRPDSPAGPSPGSFVFCHGQIAVKIEAGRAVIYVQLFEMIRASDTILQVNAPRPFLPAVVTVVGTTGKSNIDTESFELVCRGYEKDEGKVDFVVYCYKDDTPKWKRFKFREEGATAFVTGKIIGQDRVTGNLAIVILDFADLPN